MRSVPCSENNTLNLPDGRKLGYARFGDPDDFPVLFFHGIPGSRLQRPLKLEYLKELSLCLYGIERPGIGLSTPKSDRRIRDWSEDIRYFCISQGFNKTAVVGISGGSPYALAISRFQEDLVASLTLISGMAPLYEKPVFKHLPLRTRLLFSIAHKAPVFSAGITHLFLHLTGRRIDRLFSLLLTHLPECDKILLTNPSVMDLFSKDLGEALRNGSRELIREVALLLEPWGFLPEDIRQNVHIWHGKKDTILPVRLAEILMARLPRTESHLFSEKGHFFALEEAYQIFKTIRKDIEHNKNPV